MPYQSGQRLTAGERASKLGHLEVIASPFVKGLVDQFEYPEPSDLVDLPAWPEFDPEGIDPLRVVIAVDGSFQVVTSDQAPQRAIAFVKTALVRVDRRQLEKIDRDMPHPVQMKALMAQSALQASTVLPLRNVRVPDINNYDLVRNIIRDSLKLTANGIAHETLKWLAYSKWAPEDRASSPEFQCPHCHEDTSGLPYDSDNGSCINCAGEVFLSDMIGFHLEMDEDRAPDSVASAYMAVSELLMLMSVVKHFWERNDHASLANVLLIKDGPLALRGQYSKLVPNLRALFQNAQARNIPIHLVGQEKTGRFVDHLQEVARHVPPLKAGDAARYLPLSHEYIRREVDHAPSRTNPYGMRTNYGEKLLFKLDPYTSLALSIPTGAYNPDNNFPHGAADYIGVHRILATLPSLVSHQHEGALMPISLANGVASLSNYPSAAILKLFAGL